MAKPKSKSEGTVVVKYDYDAQESHELSIRQDERLTLLDGSKNWWKVVNEIGNTGYVPKNFVFLEQAEPLDSSSFGARRRSEMVDSNTQMGLTSPKCVALYPYEPNMKDELRISKGDELYVLDKSSDGWWKGQLCEDSSKCGWFPSNYVEELEAKISEETSKFVCAQSSSPPNLHKERYVLEIAECLYPFESQNPEELSFSKGELLEIMDKPAHDPEWYFARNSSLKTGLVPINYIRITGDNGTFSEKGTIQNHPLACKQWYYGSLSREQCDSELFNRGHDGDFLVRDSESNPGDFSISLRNSVKNKHFWVHHDKITDEYRIGNRSFGTMEELLTFYTKNPIFSGSNQDLYLIRPLNKDKF